MRAEEHKFLEAMQTHRTHTCGKVDTSWHNKQEEKSKQKGKQQKNQHSSMDSVSSVSAIDGTETMKSEEESEDLIE